MVSMSGRQRLLRFASLSLAGLLSAAPLAVLAQDVPKSAGTDVPAPKRAKTVLPEYPPEAQAQGIRGIVILEVVIDTEGHVASAEVVRSIAALDEAALAAVRQWQYEVTKVEGKPVSVRLTVPITFALKVPEVTRQDGIPELRQGASPGFPPEASRGKGGTVTAEVTLDTNGAVADALVTAGQPPWDELVLRALRTWKFAVDDPESILAFKVEANFVVGSKGEAGHVELHLSNPRKSKATTASAETPATQPPAAAAPPPTSATPAPTPAGQSPTAPPSAPPVPAPSAPVATPPAPPASAPPAASPPPAPPPAAASSAPSEPPKAAPTAKVAPPPVEMLSAPTPKADTPAAPIENGVSAIHEVALSPGVPDLVRGRRPVPPPLARMAGAVGTVQVRFSVNAAGGTTVVGAEGPEILKPAAEEAVSSWSFRRASAERLHLVAAFDYQLDKASATVHVEEGQP
jgi:TonB family protein